MSEEKDLLEMSDEILQQISDLNKLLSHPEFRKFMQNLDEEIKKKGKKMSEDKCS